MPLIRSKSDEARSANIATEIRHGRPAAQAKAIAYRIQRDMGANPPPPRRKGRLRRIGGRRATGKKRRLRRIDRSSSRY